MIRTALVTGSTGPIGFEIAKTLKKNNYRVILSGRNKSVLKKNSQILCAESFAFDLLEIEKIPYFVEKIFEISNSIDILVNNAGIYEYSDFSKSKNNSEILKLNLEVPILLSKFFVEKMQKQKWGRIVNIGSISGVMGEPFACAYSASKAGLIGFSKALALELASFGITVNTINPGWVETAMGIDSMNENGLSFEENIELIPQKRFIKPSEIANLVNYLASEDAKGITGQSINICAGLSVGI